MSRYRAQVAAALAAVRIVGATRYAWLGSTSPRLPAALEAELDDEQSRGYLAWCVGEELYHSFFCPGRAVPARSGEPQPPFADPRLLAALSRANTGRGSWQDGWSLERRDEREIVATDSRFRVRVPSADCRVDDAAVSLRVPKELPSLWPGFWSAVSDVSSRSCDVRVYWNVTPEGAPELVGALTSHLNGQGVPFRLKVADHPFRFQRCDAAVLYLRAGAFRALRAYLERLARALSRHLEPAIPAFTLELAPGVGLAEDDGVESYGARRCALLADAILCADGSPTPLAVVAERFAEAGVDIDAPYRAGRRVL